VLGVRCSGPSCSTEVLLDNSRTLRRGIGSVLGAARWVLLALVLLPACLPFVTSNVSVIPLKRRDTVQWSRLLGERVEAFEHPRRLRCDLIEFVVMKHIMPLKGSARMIGGSTPSDDFLREFAQRRVEEFSEAFQGLGSHEYVEYRGTWGEDMLLAVHRDELLVVTPSDASPTGWQVAERVGLGTCDASPRACSCTAK
jgi:hypothetical protein